MPRTKNPLKLDPSRTTMLRRSFVRDMNRRFGMMKKLVREAIVQEDVLGLTVGKPFALNQNVPPRQAFRFMTDAGKLDAFNAWFAQESGFTILDTNVPGQKWTAPYVESAYKKGVSRAYTQVRAEALSASSEVFEGTKKDFLTSAFFQPERLSKVQLLGSRVFEELKGINSAMGQQISRTLATGLAEGRSPRYIASQMVKSIDKLTKTRARAIARTEIIRAHSEGQLDSYEQLGIKEVGLMAEWSTAGDDRVCALCEELEGTVMTIAEARGLLPRHPNCRCAWIPANVGEKKPGRFWTKSQKEGAVVKSIKAERPGQPWKVARSKSTWPGKTKKFRSPTKVERGAGRELLPTSAPKLKAKPKPKPKPRATPKAPTKPVRVLPRVKSKGQKIPKKPSTFKPSKNP